MIMMDVKIEGNMADDMRAEYDFTQARTNPYTGRLKKQWLSPLAPPPEKPAPKKWLPWTHR